MNGINTRNRWQSDDFWFFVSNERRQQNRISFLFDLVANENGLTEAEERDDYGVFCAFSRRLSEAGVTTRSEWLEIKRAFMTLDEWYDDRTLYHIVGFLIHEGYEVQKIRDLARDCTKSAFDSAIRAEIFVHVIGESIPDDATEGDIRDLVAERVEGTHLRKAG